VDGVTLGVSLTPPWMRDLGSREAHRAFTADAVAVREGRVSRRCGACLGDGPAVEAVWIGDRGLPYLAFLCPACLAHVRVVDRPWP
jgi:hypothetical protein